MHLSYFLPVALVAIGIHAAPQAADASAAKVDYIQVKTNPGVTGSFYYPDTLSTVAKYYTNPTDVNVTCWIQTTMGDNYGIINGDDLWLGTPGPSYYPIAQAYIPRAYLKNQNINYKNKLKACTAVTHAAGRIKDAYIVDNAYYYCYQEPKTTSFQYTQYDLPYPGIQCYKTGQEKVGGNSTWVKYLPGSIAGQTDCYIPGDAFKKNDIHGTAPLCP